MLHDVAQHTVRQLADVAGVSVRTLHYYDRIGLLKPSSYTASGYRLYDRDAAVALQQILFFRELGFSLGSIRSIMQSPAFDVRGALAEHRALLEKERDRITRLLETIDKTIQDFEGERVMDIKEYYAGFSDADIEEYRREARERWGEKTLRRSEERVIGMGQQGFAAAQAEGGRIFQAIADNMGKGPDSLEVQALVAEWRAWLEHFHTYSEEAVLVLGRMYSEDPRFAAYFGRFDKRLPGFLTAAIEHYCAPKQ